MCAEPGPSGPSLEWWNGSLGSATKTASLPCYHSKLGPDGPGSAHTHCVSILPCLQAPWWSFSTASSTSLGSSIRDGARVRALVFMVWLAAADLGAWSCSIGGVIAAWVVATVFG